MAVSKFREALKAIGRTQAELLIEIKKNGYPRLNIQQLSAYGTGQVSGPQSEAVTRLAWQIIEKWTHEKSGTDDLGELSKNFAGVRAARTKKVLPMSKAEKEIALKLAGKLLDEYAEKRKSSVV